MGGGSLSSMPKLVKSEKYGYRIYRKEKQVCVTTPGLKFEVDKLQIIDLRKDKAFCVHLYKTPKKKVYSSNVT